MHHYKHALAPEYERRFGVIFSDETLRHFVGYLELVTAAFFVFPLYKIGGVLGLATMILQILNSVSNRCISSTHL